MQMTRSYSFLIVYIIEQWKIPLSFREEKERKKDLPSQTRLYSKIARYIDGNSLERIV